MYPASGPPCRFDEEKVGMMTVMSVFMNSDFEKNLQCMSAIKKPPVVLFYAFISPL
jgi:hypothetical protein